MKRYIKSAVERIGDMNKNDRVLLMMDSDISPDYAHRLNVSMMEFDSDINTVISVSAVEIDTCPVVCTASNLWKDVKNLMVSVLSDKGIYPVINRWNDVYIDIYGESSVKNGDGTYSHRYVFFIDTNSSNISPAVESEIRNQFDRGMVDLGFVPGSVETVIEEYE